MKSYHMRRSEKKIENQEEIIDIIKGQKYLTMAMCKDGEPYLVTLNYGFDEEELIFYFHCAKEGKKIDFLEGNNKVYGQILDDLGYREGRCDHSYRSVHFQGCVSFLDDEEEKKEALCLMVEQLEEEPERVKSRMVGKADLGGVKVGQIKVETLSGKESKD